DAPALDGALRPFALRDARCVHVFAGPEHFGQLVFAPARDEVEAELDALVEITATDARLHHVRALFRHVRHLARDGVGDRTDLADLVVLDGLLEGTGIRFAVGNV